jgi:hypothetical protein
MTKVNAPKRLTSMSLRNQSVKDQRMRMTSERRTDDSAIRKERAHLSCQLKASFVVNDHYRDFPPIEGSARGWPNPESSPKDPQQVGFRRTEPDFNDSSSCPKRRCSRATMTAAVSCDATQTVDERNRDFYASNPDRRHMPGPNNRHTLRLVRGSLRYASSLPPVTSVISARHVITPRRDTGPCSS